MEKKEFEKELAIVDWDAIGAKEGQEINHMENGIMVPFVWKKAGATLSKEAVKDEFNRIMFKKYPSYKDFMEDFDKKVNDYFSGWKFKSVEKMIEFRDLKYEEFEKALIRLLKDLRKGNVKMIEGRVYKNIGKKNILKRLGKEIKINFDKKEGNFEILEIEDEDDINKEFGNECKEDFNNNKYNFEKFLEKRYGAKIKFMDREYKKKD
ncbi:unnamed protein product [Rhizophagus irregularis]|uniref:Uncharacterized protein n=1 Tax=Rhizophagus irregularis TaxID=588596 RepID=A0A915Z4V8_9GLOM|nr:unnamed protein product [Rhizophagus irregularis]